MAPVHGLGGLGAPETQRALRLLVALVLVAVMAYAVVHVTGPARHDGRCQDLIASESRSAYISFEAEGCRAQVRPPGPLVPA